MTEKQNDALATLRKRVGAVSTEPGVYRWLDAAGNVLYVGKAKNLRNRMQSYVQEGVKRSAWVEIMIRQIADFDTTITNSELEALLLETNLIKQLKPKYNIMMKDDKNYVYVRISVQDQYPRVDIVRRMDEDGALYFGPKTSAEEVRGTLSFLRTLFPYRTCKMGIDVVQDRPVTTPVAEPATETPPVIPLQVLCKDRDRPTPCVDYHIKQCVGPCIGTVTPEEYRRVAIDGVVAFFQGKYQYAENILMERMREAVASRKFERAALLRDQLGRLKKTQEKQIISDASGANSDTIGAALLSGHAYIVLLRERQGKMIGEETFPLKGTADTLQEVLGQFLPQYYTTASDLPDSIILGEEPADRSTLEELLSNLRGKKIRLIIPERGKKSQLLRLAEKNADWKAHQTEAKWESEVRKVEESLASVQTLLSLPVLPKRIEGYDISHLGGTATVGSMVVFVNGKPKRDHYRSFNIRSVAHGNVDDYQSLAEVLRRRMMYLVHGLKRLEQEWSEKGVLLGKARSAEQKFLTEMSDAQPDAFTGSPIEYRDFLVARVGEEVVACCQLVEHSRDVVLLRSVFVHDAWRHQKLGRFLLRSALRRVKKGKVYVHIPSDALLEYYGELGFQHIHNPPSALEQQWKDWVQGHPENTGMLLVYIVSKQKIDESYASPPDLLLIDGGKGQLSTICQVLKEMKIEIPVVGLAKREEEIFLPGNPVSIVVEPSSQARFLLQRLRDEAHRFANDRRETRLTASLFDSALDHVEGIGEVTKSLLLQKFRSIQAATSASDEELRLVLTESQLQAFRAQFPHT